MRAREKEREKRERELEKKAREQADQRESLQSLLSVSVHVREFINQYQTNVADAVFVMSSLLHFMIQYVFVFWFILVLALDEQKASVTRELNSLKHTHNKVHHY